MTTEPELYEPLCAALEAHLDGRYECRHGEQVVSDLRYDSADEVDEQSFQADVAVFEDGVPRLVVGVTEDAPTTHQLVVYEDKARRHKRARPHLRYGLAAFGASGGITESYLWHTDALDFFFVGEHVPDPADSRVEAAGPGAGRLGLPADELSQLVHLVRRNLRASHELERVLAGRSDHVTMNRAVQFSVPARGRDPADAPIPPGE